MSPFKCFGASGVFFFILISFFNEIHDSKQNSPRWDAAFCDFAAQIWSYYVCLCPMNLKDVRLIWFNEFEIAGTVALMMRGKNIFTFNSDLQFWIENSSFLMSTYVHFRCTFTRRHRMAYT